MKKKVSLLAKFTFITSLSLFIISTVAGVCIIKAQSDELIKKNRERTLLMTEILARVTAFHIERGAGYDIEALSHMVLHSHTKDIQVLSIIIRDNSGKILNPSSIAPEKISVPHKFWLVRKLNCTSGLSHKNQTKHGNISIVFSTENTHKQIANMTINFITGALLIIILVDIIIIFLVYSIVIKPLRKFDDYSRSISLGNLDIEISHKSKDEIGIFFQRFATMNKNLRKSFERIKMQQYEINQANRELEIRVEERTSELKHINEELLKAKEDAESATRAKSEFLANMSHEIRTPMNAVLSAAELAMEENNMDEIKDYLQMIHSSGFSLMGIINDILDFSKIEANKLQLEFSFFNLNIFLHKITNIFINQSIEKDLEIIYDIDPHIPNILFGDKLRLQQIIINLISNAVKFTPARGKITFSASIFNKTHSHMFVKFMVSDTGIGIRKDYLPNLFAPFSQEDYSTTRKFGGTGLGLNICKQLVEMLNGSIWVESEENMGTTFHFTIPFDLSEIHHEELMDLPAEAKDLHLLIVNRPDEISTSIEKIISSFNYTYDMVSSYSDFLQRVNDNNYHMILLSTPFNRNRYPNFVNILKKFSAIDSFKTPVVIMTDDLRFTGYVSHLDDFHTDFIKSIVFKPLSSLMIFNSIMDLTRRRPDRNTGFSHRVNRQHPIYDKFINKLNILAAEDNDTNQKIILAILEKSGAIVDIANNGAEVLELLAKKHFDIILMDVQMPLMDGYETTRRIKAIDKFKNIPIIAMTAHAMMGDEEKCLQNGMDDYITKPIDQERLFYTIFKHVYNSIKPNSKEIQMSTTNDFLNNNESNSNDNIPELDGIDLGTALKKLHIDWVDLKPILVSFLESNMETPARVRRLYEKQEWETIEDISHGLKGSSGTIRAIKLKEATEKLEQAAKSKKIAPQLVDDFETSFNEVLGAIHKI